MSFLSKVNAKCRIAASDMVIKFVKPTFHDFWHEVQDELSSRWKKRWHESENWEAYVDVAKQIYSDGEIKTVSRQSVDIGKGEIPPKEWLLNASSVPKTIKEHPFADSGYRFNFTHHKSLLPDLLSGRPVEMPCCYKKNGKYGSMYGRHRLAYALALVGTAECFIVDLVKWDKLIKEIQ